MSRARLALIGTLVVRRSSPRSRPGAAWSHPPSTTPKPASGFETFADERGGYSIGVPAGWTRLAPPEDQVQLLATDGAGTSLLIRVARSGSTLPIARELTDSLFRADRRVELLSEPEAITLDAVPGYRYVHAYGGGAGAHIDHFLFTRGRLLTVSCTKAPTPVTAKPTTPIAR